MRGFSSLSFVSSILIGWFGLVASAASHTFFVGTTDISVNKFTHSTEIIHRFTSHDVEALLSDLHQQRISADSQQYLILLKSYVEQHFSLKDQHGEPITVDWIGIDPGINDTFIYQEIPQRTKLQGVSVTHQLLTDFFPKQKNRINYESQSIKGSLLFDAAHKQAVMR